MSDRNGHAQAPERTANELREELRRERLALRLAETRAQRQVMEQSYGSGDFGRNMPDQPAYGGSSERDWYATGGRGGISDGRILPARWLPQTTQDLFDLQSRARLLADKNVIAQGILEDLQNYTVDVGFTWRLEPKDEAAAALAQEVQLALDECHESNEWPGLEQEAILRACVDGEPIGRVFANAGTPVFRWVEPELIVPPGGELDDNWSWGILNDPEDTWRATKYHISYDGQADEEYVDAWEIHHLRNNVRRGVKRGLPDFFSTEDALSESLKLIRNVRVGAAVQAAVCGFRQVGTSQTGAQSMIDAARTAVRPPDRYSEREVNLQYQPPGSLPVIGKNQTYIPSPWVTSGNANHVAALLACLRAIGHRWRMTEYQVSGYTGNIAELSYLAAGTPFVKKVTKEQARFGAYFARINWAFIRAMADAGRFGRSYQEIRQLLTLEYDTPDVTVVDSLKRTQQREIERRNGVVSSRIWAGEEGYDYDQVAQDLATEPSPQTGANPGSGVSGMGGTAPVNNTPQPVSFSFEGLQIAGMGELVEQLRQLHSAAPQVQPVAAPAPVIVPMFPGGGAAVPGPVRTHLVRDERGLVSEIRETREPAEDTFVQAIAAQVASLVGKEPGRAD